MILILIFSKDRALQLDACLSSFARHVTDADSARMVILYAASSPYFLGQYQELGRENAMRAEFVLEENLRSQLLGAMNASAPQIPAPDGRTLISRVLRRHSAAQDKISDGMLFLVDDAIFVRSFSLAAAEGMLRANPDALGFSLRLGRNITKSYVLQRAQTAPNFQSAGPKALKFDWTRGDGDFGYPLEISSSLYRLPMMARLIRTLTFTDPNTLEGQLSLRAKRFRRSHSSMLCFETSVAFSAPLNRVQVVYENRAGSDMEYSIDRLAQRFEDGIRIDVGALDGFVPEACHEEIEPRFVKQTDLER